MFPLQVLISYRRGGKYLLPLPDVSTIPIEKMIYFLFLLSDVLSGNHFGQEKKRISHSQV